MCILCHLDYQFSKRDSMVRETGITNYPRREYFCSWHALCNRLNTVKKTDPTHCHWPWCIGIRLKLMCHEIHEHSLAPHLTQKRGAFVVVLHFQYQIRVHNVKAFRYTKLPTAMNHWIFHFMSAVAQCSFGISRAASFFILVLFVRFSHFFRSSHFFSFFIHSLSL